MVKTKKKSKCSKNDMAPWCFTDAFNKKDEFDINFMKKNEKLIDVDKIMKLYKKLLNYMKKLSNTDYEKLKNKIDKIKIKEKKLNLIRLIINENLGNNFIKVDRYIPKNESKISLKNTKCFKDYKKIDTLGQGSYGITYLVEKNKKKFAIKEQVIVSNYWSPPKDDQIELIKNEIILAKIMGEKNIGPKIYDYYMCKEKNELKVHILMEYMNEGNLETWMKENKLTTEDEKKIQDKIQKMHNENIIHNDLHSGNIFVTKKNNKYEFFIGDFGLGLTVKNLNESRFNDDKETIRNDIKGLVNNKYIDTICKLFIFYGYI